MADLIIHVASLVGDEIRCGRDWPQEVSFILGLHIGAKLVEHHRHPQWRQPIFRLPRYPQVCGTVVLVQFLIQHHAGDLALDAQVFGTEIPDPGPL